MNEVLKSVNTALDAIHHQGLKEGKQLFPIAEAPKSPSGTARQWFKERDGRSVSLLQFTRMPDGVCKQMWLPGPRQIDATRATFVSFDGSKRDYRGLRVEAASDTVLVASTEWGEGRQVCVYALDTRATPVIG